MQSSNPRAEQRIVWMVIFTVVAVVGVLFYLIIWPMLRPTVDIQFGVRTIKAEAALTEFDREKGLGGTGELEVGRGLLLVYPTEGRWKIWMKDMNYPIDIVWISADKKVVAIKKAANPDSYPKKRFVPSDDAKYVLELNTGEISNLNIKVGQQLEFTVKEAID